mgnify:CR=1 FL=1
MPTYTDTEKIQLDLLIKKALGFSFTKTTNAPGQEISTLSNVYDSQIFSQPIPNTNITSEFTGNTTIIDTGSANYYRDDHPTYSYIKK